VVATLVRRRRAGGDDADGTRQHLDVLYVHGWSDYFFQTGLADFWESHGARGSSSTTMAAGGPGAIGKEEAQVLDHEASMHPPPGPGANPAGW
ncbi:hypothetical protein ACFU49_21395, partial [Streptomyces albidoflavus]